MPTLKQRLNERVWVPDLGNTGLGGYRNQEAMQLLITTVPYKAWQQNVNTVESATIELQHAKTELSDVEIRVSKLQEKLAIAKFIEAQLLNSEVP